MERGVREMTELIKRDDALAAIDTFRRDFEQSWKVQFSADIKALPAVKDDRIEQLNERLTAATDDAKEAEAYAEQLEAKLAKAVEALRPFADVLKGNYFHQPDTLPISMGFGHYDRRWALKLMDFRNARAVLAELEGQ